MNEKKGLGDVASSRGELLYIDPRIIKIEDGFNVRDFDSEGNKDHVEALAASIAEVGVLNPITVRYDHETGEAILVDGESRLRATLLAIANGADIKTIKAIAEDPDTSEADRVAALLTRSNGKRPEPMEMVTAVRRLRELGWKDSEIARRAGVTGPYISGLLKLYAAPDTIKKMVSEGKVAAAFAIETLRSAKDDDEALAILSAAVAEAALRGKDRATPKHAAAALKKRQTNELPYYKREIVNGLVSTLCELAADGSLPRSVRERIRGALRNAGVNYQSWNELAARGGRSEAERAGIGAKSARQGIIPTVTSTSRGMRPVR